jgi:hypothetical protein
MYPVWKINLSSSPIRIKEPSISEEDINDSNDHNNDKNDEGEGYNLPLVGGIEENDDNNNDDEDDNDDDDYGDEDMMMIMMTNIHQAAKMKIMTWNPKKFPYEPIIGRSETCHPF